MSLSKYISSWYAGDMLIVLFRFFGRRYYLFDVSLHWPLTNVDALSFDFVSFEAAHSLYRGMLHHVAIDMKVSLRAIDATLPSINLRCFANRAYAYARRRVKRLMRCRMTQIYFY